MKKNQSKVSKARANDLAEIERLRDELGIAYRALGAYALAHRRGTRLPAHAVAYHSLAEGAAARFKQNASLDGARYFLGKSVDVLHEALRDPAECVAPKHKDHEAGA